LSHLGPNPEPDTRNPEPGTQCHNS
jgi:hypothetical protein